MHARRNVPLTGAGADPSDVAEHAGPEPNAVAGTSAARAAGGGQSGRSPSRRSGDTRAATGTACKGDPTANGGASRRSRVERSLSAQTATTSPGEDPAAGQQTSDGAKKDSAAQASGARIAPASAAVARRIQEHRHALGLSQEAFARRLDVTRQTVSNWECARTIPDALALGRIAAACGTTADALLGTEGTDLSRRALAARRELVSVAGIVLALQFASMLFDGISLSTSGTSDSGAFAAFRLGALLVGGLWIGRIARREGLSTVRQIIDFASLASERSGGIGDRLLRFVGRWFWTLWLVIAAALYALGALVGIMRGAVGAEALIAPALLLLVATIPYTWERHTVRT